MKKKRTKKRQKTYPSPQAIALWKKTAVTYGSQLTTLRKLRHLEPFS